VALSLQTRGFRLAEALAEELDAAFERFFEVVRMTAFDVGEALRQYLLEERAKLRKRHIEAQPGRRIHGSDLQGFDGHERDLTQIDNLIASLRISLARRRFYIKEHDADAIIGAQEATEDQRRELALGLLQADIQTLEQSREWLTNGLTEDIAAAPAAQVSQGAVAAAVTPTPAVEATGPTLTEALPAFLSYMTNHKGWRGQTLAQNTTTYRMLEEVCGDKPVASYTRRDTTAFYDLLRALPADYSRNKQWKGLTLKEIVERSSGMEVERLTMKTIKRHFSGLGSFFTFLKRRGEYEGENPGHGFEFPQGKKRANQRRQMWEGERLTKLFNSPVWNGCKSETQRSTPGSLIIKDEKYWMPILGLYHGNRLEEFAQLLRGDVRCTDGIWRFDLNDDGVKHLKNEQSKRRVPIHPVVIAMGFLEYVETTAPKADSPVFPQLLPGGPDMKRGFYFTKWWSRYRQAIGVFEKGYDYHSFRHGMTTKLAAAGVSLELRNELLGHEGASTDEKVYLKGLPLEQLAEAIAKVEWPEVAGVLKPIRSG
jgi:integrase